MLHIIKHPQQLAIASRYFQPNDAIVLVENAVYATSEQSPFFGYFNNHNPVYVLKEDLEARGWLNRCAQNIQIMNVADWVELTVNYDKSMSW
ncbi:sulfurtransferase complex subunit TusB [Vibrio fluvialis]|nr:sulfurtransferase complex subunit TusB [Vibrio fluvialis]MBY7801246.1 sulfurtransferase complex subunit TusB [Vibrio fluvialis]